MKMKINKNKKILITIIITVFALLMNTHIINPSAVKIIPLNAKNAATQNVRNINIINFLQNENTNTIRIMTFNLLAHFKSWGGKEVEDRKALFLNMLNEYSPVVLGIQEMCDDWYSVLTSEQTTLKFVTPLKNHLPLKMTSLLYNSSILELLESGNSAFKKVDDSRLRRIVWGVFKDRNTSEIFTVVTTHLTVLKKENLEENFFLQASQVNELYTKIEEIYKEYPYPVIIIGDFNTARKYGKNSPLHNGSYGILSSLYTDCENVAENKIHGENKSFTDTLNDHIFIKGSINVKTLNLLSIKEYENLSDHYPLFCDIYF